MEHLSEIKKKNLFMLSRMSLTVKASTTWSDEQSEATRQYIKEKLHQIRRYAEAIQWPEDEEIVLSFEGDL